MLDEESGTASVPYGTQKSILDATVLLKDSSKWPWGSLESRNAVIAKLMDYELSPWIEDLNRCIAIMDEKGRTGPAGKDHTTMLWTKDWEWVRTTLWAVLENMKHVADVRDNL